MEQFIESLVAAGIDRERIEKARRRGTAYQCLRCQEIDGCRVINIKCRMEDHVLRKHMERERIPFRYMLCEFKCCRRDQIFMHIESYTRHVTAAAKLKVTDHFQYLIESPNPHVYGSDDFVALTPMASLLHFWGVGEVDPIQTVTSPVVPSPCTTPSAFRPIQVTNAVATIGSEDLACSSGSEAVIPSGLSPSQASTLLSTSRAVGLSDSANQIATTIQNAPSTLKPIPMTTVGSMVVPQPVPTAHMLIGQAQAIAPYTGQVTPQEGVSTAAGPTDVTKQLTDILKTITGIVQRPDKHLDLCIRTPEVIGECARDEENIPEITEESMTKEFSQPEEATTVSAETGAEGNGAKAYPPYIPTPITREETETPIPREEDILDLADDNMSIATPTKRTREEDGHQECKRAKGESLPVDMKDLSERTLADLVGKALIEAEKSRKVQERMLKAMEDSICVQAKLADAVGKLRGAVDDLNRDSRRREERRRAFEDRWEDEWKREWNKKRDDDRKAEARRRELEQEERKKEEEEEKENNTRPRSTLGRVYTKNTVSEGNRRKTRN